MSYWFLDALYWFVLIGVVHRIACWTACWNTFDETVPALRQWAYTLSTLVIITALITGGWWLSEVLSVVDFYSYILPFLVIALYVGIQLAAATRILKLPRGLYLKFLVIMLLTQLVVLFIYGFTIGDAVMCYLFCP